MEAETYASFLIRLWCDQLSRHAPCDWHAEVEHVQTGIRWKFGTPADLFAFLEQAVAAPQKLAQAAPNEKEQTLCHE